MMYGIKYKLTNVCKDCYDTGKLVRICPDCDELRCLCPNICDLCNEDSCKTYGNTQSCKLCGLTTCMGCTPDCCVCGKEGEELSMCQNCMTAVGEPSLFQPHKCPTC